jgi:hypothetical protein
MGLVNVVSAYQIEHQFQRDSEMLDNPSGVFGIDSQAGAKNTAEDEDVLIIAASGLFDDDWYISQNPDVARSGINPLFHYVRFGAGEGRVPIKGFNAARYVANVEAREPVTRNPLAHYILHGNPDDLLSKGLLTSFSTTAIKGAMDRLSAMPIFKVDDYITLNEDIKTAGGHMDVDPLNHAVVHGFPEGRNVFVKTTVARVMGAAAAAPFGGRTEPRPGKKLPRLPPVGIYFNTRGNAFIREIAEDLVATLRDAGQDATLLDQTAPQDGRPPVCIFVAPHEFFHIDEGRRWAREDILRSALLFTTEQPQTMWFDRAMPFVLMARGLIDIAWQVTSVFREAGIPALFFNPNIKECSRWLRDEDLNHPLLRVLPKRCQAPDVRMENFAARPIDISFFGTESYHREKFFTKSARFFAEYEAFLYYRKVESPLLAQGSHAALSRLAGHVGAHSKISLNIHRDSSGFFEWHRIAKLGMVSGSVVVSEPCPPHPVLKPGTHYLEESGRHILNLIEWLLKTEDGRRKAQTIQDNALAVVRNRDLAARNSHSLVTFIHEHCGAA